jgi:hypothetical protein
MKRIALLTVLGGLILLSLSCELPPPLDTYNDIEYPVGFGLLREQPGDPITLIFAFCFQDETLDTSGVDFDWSKRGDTLWFLLKGKDGEIDHNGPYRSRLDVNVGALEKGSYTLLLEGERGAQDTLTLTVEDSVYYLSGYDGEVAKPWAYDTLRRLFPDMLLVEVGARESGIDSMKQDLVELGGVECHVAVGSYSMFKAVSFDTFWVYGDRASSDEWSWNLDFAGSLLFTYDGDTMRLDSLFNSPSVDVGALSMRMGNGFDRYYRWWVD